MSLMLECQAQLSERVRRHASNGIGAEMPPVRLSEADTGPGDVASAWRSEASQPAADTNPPFSRREFVPSRRSPSHQGRLPRDGSTRLAFR